MSGAGVKTLYDGMRFHCQHACANRIPWLTPNPAGSMTIKKIVLFGVGSSPLGSNFPPTSTPTATMTPTETETCGARNLCEPTPTPTSTPTATVTPTMSRAVCRVVIDPELSTDVFVRSGPSTSGTAIIGLLLRAQEIAVSAFSLGWYQFYAEDTPHYVLGSLVIPQDEVVCDELPSFLEESPEIQSIGFYCLAVLMPVDDTDYCTDTVYQLVKPVYDGFRQEVGGEPSLEQILAVTLQTEFWGVRTEEGGNGLVKVYGVEGLSRAYFNFCATDGCNLVELLWYLSGYQPWKVGVNEETGLEDAIVALYNAFVLVSDDLQNPSSEMSTTIGLVVEPVESAWESGWDPIEPWQWFNRDTSVTRPTEGIGECTQVLLRVESINFEMYTGAQTNAINQSTCR